ncbi:MAG: MATE family efflux transporter [Candidatus Adiutrix sp.]|jgi:MATE family multidrug resistance protein|nr:MATE family efflux transporter [Candidatus Adiutrix sp.]
MTSLIRAFQGQLRKMLLLSGPILISQYAYLASGVVDTVMSGKLGTVDQAGVAVGAAVWIPVQMFITGTLYGFLILLSQVFGSDKLEKLAELTQQAVWLALILGGLFGLLLWLLAPGLPVFGTAPEVAAKASDYLRFLVWGLPFSSTAIALRFFCDGQQNVVPATVIAIVTVLINILLNYGLMFGRFGLPDMGVRGCGLATSISMVISAIFFAAYVSWTPRYRQTRPLATFYRPVAARIKHIFSTGLPIGCALVSEFLVLTFIAICISSRGAVDSASHQIAFNFMMILFAMPTSVSMASSIMVAGEHGAGNISGKREVVLCSISLGAALGLVLTFLMYFSAHTVAGLYSHDPQVIALATSLLMVAALFQFVDALQICLNGCLRGIEDTVAPFLITSGLYWLLTLPAGWLLAGMPLPAFLTGLLPDFGVAGWWYALVLGVSLVALALGNRCRRLFFGPRSSTGEQLSPIQEQLEKTAS